MFDNDRFTQDCLDAIREIGLRAPAKVGRASR